MPSTASAATQGLRRRKNPKLATFLKRFFRTGPGEYGENDRFLGIKVPTTRAVAREFVDLPLAENAKLLASPFHEERLLALVILTRQFARRGADRDAIFRHYLKHRSRVNNWDLVDLSAPNIIGPFLAGPGRAEVARLSRSKSLWDRRISVVAHAYEIRAGDPAPFLAFAPRFLEDPEDLMHKAVGWMLRECGQRDAPALRRFLARYAARMPRTMLRYAIEKLPPAERRAYLSAPRAVKPRP